MIVTRRRAVAAGAWAAVLLALAVTGPQWAFTPWFAAAALLGMAALLGYALGLFDRHSSQHAAPRRRLDWDEPAPKAIEAPEPAYAGPPAHSPDWPMDATLTGTEILPPMPVSLPQVNGHGEPLLTDAEGAQIADLLLGDLANWKPSGFRNDGPVPAVTVTDDPAGRHARPRVHAIAPYCAAPGCTSRSEHWTEEHPRPDPLVDELLKARADRELARAAVASAQLPDYAIEALGHHTVDAAVDSIFTRAMGNAIAAVEEARR